MSTYQGRMLVLSNHSNLHMLFEVVAQALTKGEGMGGDSCEAIMGYLTHSADAARWLVQVRFDFGSKEPPACSTSRQSPSTVMCG